MGPPGQTRHPDRRRPAGLGARLVRAARQRRLAKALRRHRPCARYPPSRGARARARRPPRRYRWPAAHFWPDALGPARGRSCPGPSAAIPVRWLGLRRGAEAYRGGAHLPPRARRALSTQPLRRPHAHRPRDRRAAFRPRSARARFADRPTGRLRRRRAQRSAGRRGRRERYRGTRDRRLAAEIERIAL